MKMSHKTEWMHTVSGIQRVNCILIRAFKTMLLPKKAFLSSYSLLVNVHAPSRLLVLVFVGLCGRSCQLTEDLKLTPSDKNNGSEMG